MALLSWHASQIVSNQDGLESHHAWALEAHLSTGVITKFLQVGQRLRGSVRPTCGVQRHFCYKLVRIRISCLSSGSMALAYSLTDRDSGYPVRPENRIFSLAPAKEF